LNNFKVISKEKCGICGKFSNFTMNNNYILYREAICENCGATIRNSDLGHLIIQTVLNKKNTSLREEIDFLKKFDALEASCLGAINEQLKKSEKYVGFEYEEGVASGEINGNFLNQDLQDLSFLDNSFDLVITQDVLEHVKNPGKAFSEIFRVLKLGGYHIFTIPYHENKTTVDRRDLPKIFHGDQLREDGALVYTDWGVDIFQILDRYGYSSIGICCHRWFEPHEISDVDNEYTDYFVKNVLEYFKYNSWVFISKKIIREIEI
jgi:SAM-dependent methyltransferase